MKKYKAYRLKKLADKQKGKFKCHECDRAFKTALARSNHGVAMHLWECIDVTNTEREKAA